MPKTEFEAFRDYAEMRAKADTCATWRVRSPCSVLSPNNVCPSEQVKVSSAGDARTLKMRFDNGD
jgi:hypothetical protein